MTHFFFLANNSTAAPMTTDPSFWAQWGMPGLIIFSLGLYVLFLTKQHRDERKEYREDVTNLALKFDATTQEATDKFVGLHKDMLNSLGNRKADDG